MTTLLSTIRAQLVVDVDSMDPAVAARHVKDDTHMFCDMTSNQAIVYNEAVRPERSEHIKTACEQAKATGLDIEQQVTDALDLLTALLAKDVYPYLTGRVHAQTSPSYAYDTEGTIAHAKRLVGLFESIGIPKVCVKIPATPESIIACQYLEKVGIRTLATCLFSLPQAVAASQAGCLYVAPYFNELRVHFEPNLWKEYENTAEQHPTAVIIRSIVQTFRTIGSKTLVMPASIVNAAEVVALASLHPDHITLPGAVLDQLTAETNKNSAISSDQQPDHRDVTQDVSASVKDIDFLKNSAQALKKALEADPEATRKLADALKIFGEMEQKAKDLLRRRLTA